MQASSKYLLVISASTWQNYHPILFPCSYLSFLLKQTGAVVLDRTCYVHNLYIVKIIIMSRHGEYDFPAPPPMSGEFECIPLHDQTMPVTEQPERIFIGQPDRTPRIQETSQKGHFYGGHEGPMSPSYRSDFMPPQYRQEDNRLMRDNSIARGTGQSQTMPRPVQQQPISHTEPSRPMQKYSRPSSLSAEPNMQRQTAKQDQYRPPPVAQKPGQRPVFNYVSIDFVSKNFLRWRKGEFCQFCFL